jgi:hypothetical protein
MKHRRRARLGGTAVGATYACPHCGETVDTAPDPGAGSVQEYIEDCPVCCRPNRITARWDEDLDDFSVFAGAEV